MAKIASVSGTVLSGRYKLDSKLGSGGMSTVYLAQDEVLDRPVAVKLLHREISEDLDQLERFRREARAAARLSHPNLVSVIDAGEDEGRPYIVFEYVEGDTLKRKITEQGGLEVDEAVAYGIEIGRGLIAAHGRKLVHRDVKPQNVLIDTDGRAKVTDFGIARSLDAKGMTATGRVLGTTDYVSPEQAMGEDVDERSDVYSLGIVLYEMLTGDVPFSAETQVGVAMKHVNEPLPDVLVERPDVSAAVASVVDRSTTKDPRDRYNGVGEMVRDLEATLEVEAARGGGTSGGQATTVLDSVPKSRRKLGGRRPLGSRRRPGHARARRGRRGADLRRRPARLARQRRPARQTAARRSRSIESGADGVRPVPRRRQGDRDGGARGRRRPDRDGVGDRALRHRGLRRDQGRGRAGGPGGAAGRRDGHRDPAPQPRAGTPRSTAPPEEPPDDLEGWGSPVSTITDGGERQTVDLDGAEAHVVPDLDHQAARQRGAAGALPDADLGRSDSS